VPIAHAVVVLDIAEPDRPVEVSRAVLGDAVNPHWTGYDAKTRRVAITGYGQRRLFMLTFDPESGRIAVDTAFHDEKGQPGFDFDMPRTWPHGWTGASAAHGVVFSK
jgi:hypothetical protein